MMRRVLTRRESRLGLRGWVVLVGAGLPVLGLLMRLGLFFGCWVRLRLPRRG